MINKIRLSENFRAVFYAPFYATHALGFYAREGVELELINSATPGGATDGLIDGSIDATWGGPMRVMKARDEAKGFDLVCFCEMVRKDPFYLIGKPRGADFKITDLSHLKFASVSEVPTPWLCLQHDLRELGIDPAEIDRVADRSMADNLEALRGGKLDVAQMFEPYATMAVSSGIGQIRHAASSRGDTTYSTLLATRASVEKNRAAFAAMVRANAAMQDWLSQHNAEDLARVVAPYFPSVAKEHLVAVFGRYMAAGLWAKDTAVSRQGFSRLAASLHSGKFISRMPIYEDCVIEFPLR